MKKAALVWFVMILFAVPCLAFDYPGHEGQIPLCQNNMTGALRFPKIKDVDPSKTVVDYEPVCNPKFIRGTTTPAETLIWVSLGSPSGLSALIEPMQNVSEDTVLAQGWTECYSDTYNDGGTPISTILSQCSKKYLMLACRPAGSSTFTLASYANRNDVMTDTGDADNNVTRIANGTGWYYNSNHSWGFAKAGDGVRKSSCDYPEAFNQGGNLDMRLCWHTNGGFLSPGFRCGTTIWDTTWERVIMHHN